MASYGQYNNSQGSGELPYRYGGYVPPRTGQQQTARRTPSYNTGDDGNFYEDLSERGDGNYGDARYRTGTSAGIQNEELFMGPSGPIGRTSSTMSATSGAYPYHGQYPTSSDTAIRSTYNPQEYARPQSHYTPQTPQTYSSPTTPNLNQHQSYPTYNPAAYQITNAPVPSNYNPQGYGSNTYASASPYPAPTNDLPTIPQPYEQPYGRRLSQSSSGPYSNQTLETNYRNAPLPPLPNVSPLPEHNSAWTPPAPPPPPFSPHRDAFPPPQIHTSVPMRPYTHSNSPAITSASPVSNSGQPSIYHRYPGVSDYAISPSSHSSASSPFRGLPASPRPTPPQHSPQRTNTGGRHPQSRPLPGPPLMAYDEGMGYSNSNGEQSGGNNDNFGYEDIMKEVEAALDDRNPSFGNMRTGPRHERVNHQSRQEEDPIDEGEEPQPLFSNLQHGHDPDTADTHTNGESYSDESDAEAAAGLEAMRLAEEQEAADTARRLSGHTVVQSSRGCQRESGYSNQKIEHSSDSDVPVDMETYGGGGFTGNLDYHYGKDLDVTSHLGDSLNPPYPTPSNGSWRSDLSNETLDMPNADYFMSGEDAIHPFPAFNARVDTDGTGGFSEPGAARRLSFEDGDEASMVDSDNGQISGAPSPARDSGTYSYPSRSMSRPLPQIPGVMTSDAFRKKRQTDQFGRPVYPQAPDEYEQSYTGAPVHKANSIGSHSTTPLVIPPGRSITDAEQRRRQQQGPSARTSLGYDSYLIPDTASSTYSKPGDLDLPTIPAGKRRKFIPGKLSTSDFKRCSEPWALGSILAWVKEMTEGENDLKEQLIVDGIVTLFTHKVPTMNTADAEALSAKIVCEMLVSGSLVKEEEWVKLGANPISGVLYQLTGTGCYAPKLHDHTIPGRCYSHHCMRTLKKINLQTQGLSLRKTEDWPSFYDLKKEELEKHDKKDIERQYNLHEIVTSEDYFMDQLNVLRLLYRDGLANSPQPIISPKRLPTFLRDVFGKVDAVKKANEEYLLPQLKYRQQEEGPWISGFSDIFREWIRKAKTPYIEYAATLPSATLLVKREADRNILFRQFLEQIRENERSGRLGWDSFLKAPITRLQRYGLLLSTVYKNMPQDSPEKSNLATAIDEIKAVTLECDTRVAEMTKRVLLNDLTSKLKLRPGMEKVQLNLSHLGRQIYFEGDLQRKGNNKVSWLETHAILFDHYLVLAKPIQQRDAAGGVRQEIFDVSKLPIPMDLLVLESTNDDPVVKSAVKGIASVSTVTSKLPVQDPRLGRTVSNQSVTTGGPGTLTHSNTNTSSVSNGTSSSSKTLVTNTILDSPNEKVMYPFKIRHLGKAEVYVLYAPSAQNRLDWCESIIVAKTRHAASLFAQNAEPFRLRVVADTAFAYDNLSGGPRGIVIKGTPLDRAIEEVEKRFRGTGSNPGPVCRAQVNCATTFTQPFGKQMMAVGTDYGVYITDYDNPRGWTRAIAASKVTQVAVLEDFNLFLIIADKALIAHHLDTICPIGGAQNTSSDSSARKAPQKLSGTRDVGFFATGRMKDRTLVFYKKREGISSTFKVLEPVYQKSSVTSRTRFGIRKGTTDFFRDFDDFYIPAETYSINLFHSSLGIATARGIEVMTLDKKAPITIPDLRPPEVASIAARIKDQRSLGMFRLTETEFLLVFEEVGIYVDKYGDVSRAVVMEFVGRAKQATLYNSTYLVLIDVGSGFVEVRNAMNGRLRQVISGRDVRLLDDGHTVGGTSGTEGLVKICMQHPEMERHQVVLEMIVNEGLKE